jgi:hypothetical protein
MSITQYYANSQAGELPVFHLSGLPEAQADYSYIN